MQRCPSCHQFMETTKHSSGKPKCYKNMDAILDDCVSQRYELSPIQVACGFGTSNPYHHSRKKQSSGHQCQRMNDEDQILLTNMDGCCAYPQSMENGCSYDHWIDYKLAEEFRNKRESRNSRQRRKDELEDETVPCRRKSDHEDSGYSKLGFDLSRYDTLKNVDAGTVENDLEDRRTRKKFHNRPNFGRGVNIPDYSKDRPLANQDIVDAIKHKPRKRSTVRKYTVGRGEEDSKNKNEIVEEEEDREAEIKKNIYAGGDLNLCATKNLIVGLIDEALSQDFGSSTDQPKNSDSNRGLTKQEPCVEIMHALQGDCWESTKDLLTHRGLNAECLKQLKMLRWEHMNRIQNMCSKLCNLQKFLDSYSPRLSMSAPQQHAAAVEQRAEDRQQQQHEEK
ncbi:uncharacterized protein LOC116432705 [Nomia melanderi]|uniref:uncharacterized protein LOC116432705 n=1 Tax=Nomia melanderi TaxID=2448451 RepID=UPI003FCD7F82